MTDVMSKLNYQFDCSEIFDEINMVSNYENSNEDETVSRNFGL